MRSGRNVHITIDPNSADSPILALEAREGLSGLIWEPLKPTDVRPPNPDALQRDMEEYVKRKAGERTWSLARCTILSVEDDHFLVDLSEADAAGLNSQTAVLPKNRLASNARDLEKGKAVWAVATQKSRAQIDGSESWHQVNCSYVASRTDSIFLRFLIKKYWHLDVSADITNGAGLVILPTEANLGAVIGPNGRYIEQLKEISGLSRIVVARSVANKRPDLRLSSAIRQIVAIEGVRVRPPARDSEEWRLVVRTAQAPILIGSNGTNLRFISVLSGLKIKYVVRDGA